MATLDRKIPLETQSPEVQLAACLGQWSHPETIYAPTHAQHLHRVLLKGPNTLTKVEQDDILHHEKLLKNW